MDGKRAKPQQDPDFTLDGSRGDPDFKPHLFNKNGYCRWCERKRKQVSEGNGRPAISCTRDAAQLTRDAAKLCTETFALAQAIEGFNAATKARRLARGGPAQGLMLDVVGQPDEA